MHRIRAGAVLAIIVLAMAPASRAGTPSCPAGFEEFTEYRLFFGRSRGDVEVVSDKAWRGFLAAEITPRFPGGLTVLDAAGQWRDGSGAIMRERTKLVRLISLPLNRVPPPCTTISRSPPVHTPTASANSLPFCVW